MMKQIAIVLLFCGALMNAMAQPPAGPGTRTGLEYDIRPFKKNGLFREDDKVGYDVRLKNSTYTKQRGSMHIDVFDAKGASVFNQTVSFFTDSRKTFATDLNLDYAKLTAGFYDVNIIVSTTSAADTLRYVFGLDPDKIFTDINKPEDFEEFWSEARREMLRKEPRFRIISRGNSSTKYVNVYQVEFQSVDDVVVRGWLTIPKGGAKYPVIYQLPDYYEDQRPDSNRSDMAVFRLNVRGHGNSADKVFSDYSTLNTMNLYDRDKYIYKGIYMDCLRGLDFIYKYANQLNLDADRVVVYGEGQGGTLAGVTCAMDQRPKCCIMVRPVYGDLRGLFEMNQDNPVLPWPVSAFNDYINSGEGGINKQRFYENWDFYDPVNFMSNIKCKVLFALPLINSSAPPQTAFSIYNQLKGDVKEMYVCSGNTMDYVYYAYQNLWIKKVLRLP
ncbi:MAG: acetylxylan esterase [Chitinophagaceae bacterium]|nr:acetylxylan esterase [Chitinophagaceae bacterium]